MHVIRVMISLINRTHRSNMPWMICLSPLLSLHRCHTIKITVQSLISNHHRCVSACLFPAYRRQSVARINTGCSLILHLRLGGIAKDTERFRLIYLDWMKEFRFKNCELLALLGCQLLFWDVAFNWLSTSTITYIESFISVIHDTCLFINETLADRLGSFGVIHGQRMINILLSFFSWLIQYFIFKDEVIKHAHVLITLSYLVRLTK